MSPVEPGLPHACLSPQRQHAALFPMQLSALSTCGRTIATWHAPTHMCADSVGPATPATFPNQHPFNAAAQPNGTRRCVCLLWDLEGGGQNNTEGILRYTGQITCGNLSMWIPEDSLISFCYPLIEVGRLRALACVRCISLLPQQQHLQLVGNRTAGEPMDGQTERERTRLKIQSCRAVLWWGRGQGKKKNLNLK